MSKACAQPRVRIELSGQYLWLLAADGRAEAGYLVSTAAHGPGERMNSGRSL